MRLGPAALLALLGVLGAAAPAAGHGRSLSYSSWSLEPQGARVRARIPLLELTRLPAFGGAVTASDPRVAAYLATQLQLLAPAPCPLVDGPRALSAQPGWARVEWRVACPGDPSRSIESGVLLDVAPSHLHFARVHEADGSVRERVLAAAAPRWELGGSPDEPQPEGTSLAGYVGLGVEHIVSGVDHLAFLLALVLLAASLGEVATLVTGFTVAHSLTLGLAALGVLHPDATAVEALIGFSVALVAAENAWLLAGRGRRVPAAAVVALLALAALAAGGWGGLSPLTLLGLALFSGCHFGLLARVQRPGRLRAAIAFAFGLVHGFGFAGVLAELALPRERLLPALFGFNVGVELGQLALVALAWPLLHRLGRLGAGRARLAIAEVGSAAICALGVFWFVGRTFS